MTSHRDLPDVGTWVTSRLIGFYCFWKSLRQALTHANVFRSLIQSPLAAGGLQRTVMSPGEDGGVRVEEAGGFLGILLVAKRLFLLLFQQRGGTEGVEGCGSSCPHLPLASAGA